MSNVETAYQFFLGNGFTAAQSAGIVGNLIQESGVNPESVQPNGPGRGIAQWSVGQRWNPALATGNPSVDLPAQEQYILDELQSNPSYGLSQLKQATTPTQAAQIFGSDYERYGDIGGRLQDAQNVYQAAQTNNWPMATSGSITPTAQDMSTSGDIFNAMTNAMFPGFSVGAGNAGISDTGKIAEEIAGIMGFAGKKQPQTLTGSGFLNSLDELLNPSITLLSPWNAITMAMARGGIALFGLALLAAGVAVIVFGSSVGQRAVGDSVKAMML